MNTVLTWKGLDISIGAYTVPGRKKFALCIRKGNKLTKYGYFSSTDDAVAFMDELGILLGAKMIDGEAGGDGGL